MNIKNYYSTSIYFPPGKFVVIFAILTIIYPNESIAINSPEKDLQELKVYLLQNKYVKSNQFSHPLE